MHICLNQTPISYSRISTIFQAFHNILDHNGEHSKNKLQLKVTTFLILLMSGLFDYCMGNFTSWSSQVFLKYFVAQK